jgi:2-methylisocitrate lyase-like PEP mutase family enzyme
MVTNGTTRPTAAQKLRAMLDDPEKLIVCPGVYDGYTARIALAENVDCLYMVGSYLCFPLIDLSFPSSSWKLVLQNQEGCHETNEADIVWQTGAGTTMSVLGMADMGVATMNDMRDNASMIANLDPDTPLIADADTGYGGMHY